MDYSVGGAQTEVYVYDDLGNRNTYTRDSANIVYTNNEANEYATIDTNGGGAVSVFYDAAGNLSRDENDFEYAYDYDNRLTLISYDDGQALTQVVAYEYDALGRMVYSNLRFDSDTDGDSEEIKYYYDGQNTIAEYDMSDNLSRRYVHGTQYVDERALLIEGEPATADTYYYLLQELYTVTGLIKRNGTLVEAYTYNAYGKVDSLVKTPSFLSRWCVTCWWFVVDGRDHFGLPRTVTYVSTHGFASDVRLARRSALAEEDHQARDETRGGRLSA